MVLKNLVANAIKFTDQRQRHGAARRQRDGGVELDVADTGIGIAADGARRYLRALPPGRAARRRRYGGVGLGLYIVQRLLDRARRPVAVESELGRGSTFRVWLPLPDREPATANELGHAAA